MAITSRFRLLPPFCALAASLILSGQAANPDEPPGLFDEEANVSDLRGVLNVFGAFAAACLDQPVTRDLPEALLPEGYKIVSLGSHLFGVDTEDRSDTAVLTKTGSEEGDWKGGYPIVRFTMPSEAEPAGGCSVAWKRAWDDPDARDALMLDLVARLEARVSYELEAILTSDPLDLYEPPAEAGGDVTHWLTSCWDNNDCTFAVAGFFSREDGIDLTLERTSVVREGQGGTP